MTINARFPSCWQCIRRRQTPEWSPKLRTIQNDILKNTSPELIFPGPFDAPDYRYLPLPG
jgi:hypothetical protein